MSKVQWWPAWIQSCILESGFKDPEAIIKNTVYFTGDKQIIRKLPKPAEGNGILDGIRHLYPAGDFLKLVPMPPKGVWPFSLFIGKCEWLFHTDNFGDPCESYQWQDGDSVDNHLTFTHFVTP